eukprot:TRINITY_DN7066_c0_g1_i1.p1 TRINITY_DN7066_c0_g1~~TRINITY_DN7066_c0_g1_i1.p1  ORF type:complete len:497 (-),score=131.85 TRINITY_DN7066_c0_g1_i1:265-1755(-)
MNVNMERRTNLRISILIFACCATFSGAVNLVANHRLGHLQPDLHNFGKGSPLVNQYRNISNLLIKVALSTTNTTKIEYLCDTFGPRYCGTPNLENAIDWILETMISEGLENVHPEPVVNITNWIRGTEYATLTSPRPHNIALLGLGNSVGTPADGITADVLVVSSFADLTANAAKAKGKIVVFNVPFTTYSETVAYRFAGADAASKVGGVAALIRSVTPYSLYTPHTGEMGYGGTVPPVPTAAITVEDAEMFARMQGRGQHLTIKLYMEAKTGPMVASRNVIAEVVGREAPQEVLVFGGHVDSWDVGQGAMDDGGGLFTAWEMVRIISQLVSDGLIPRPRRTIRAVFWVNEENGARGATTYLQDHVAELPNHVLAVESDSGNFNPIGFGFTGAANATAIVRDLSHLLEPIGVNGIFNGSGADTDNGPLVAAGVPGMSLISAGFSNWQTDNYYYFNYHHSNADSITSLDYDGLRLSVAAEAVYAYVIADMEDRLPTI